MPIIRELWLEMKAILRAGRQRINGELEPLGLSGAEGDILFHLLTGSDRFPQERLAEQLDIGKAAISRTIDALEAKGYVARARRADDRRAFRVCLTERGRAVGPAVAGVYERLYARAGRAIPDEEFRRVASLLLRVSENLRSPEDAPC